RGSSSRLSRKTRSRGRSAGFISDAGCTLDEMSEDERTDAAADAPAFGAGSAGHGGEGRKGEPGVAHGGGQICNGGASKEKFSEQLSIYAHELDEAESGLKATSAAVAKRYPSARLA